MPTPSYDLLSSATITNTSTTTVTFSNWNTSYFTLFVWASLSSNATGAFDVPYWEVGDGGTSRNGTAVAIRYNDFDSTVNSTKNPIINVSYMSGSAATNVFGVNTWSLYNPNASTANFARVAHADGSQQSRANTSVNWSMSGYFRSGVTNSITQLKIYAPDGRTFLPNSTFYLYGVASA